jgi:hypothetical protein
LDRNVLKEFNDVMYKGVVVSMRKFSGSMLFKVKYEDGDEEESTLAELQRLMLHPARSLHDTAPQTKKKFGAHCLDTHTRIHRNWSMPFGLPFKDFENMDSASDEEDEEGMCHWQRALQALSDHGDTDSESESDHNVEPNSVNEGENQTPIDEKEADRHRRRLEAQLDDTHPLRPSSVPKHLSEVSFSLPPPCPISPPVSHQFCRHSCNDYATRIFGASRLPCR